MRTPRQRSLKALRWGNFFSVCLYNNLMSNSRPLIVTHHAPDLDAITSTWLLKRFHPQDFADARIGFVNPGDTISLEEAEELGCQLHEITYVDTGFGKFDHHQPEKATQRVCAATLVYDAICEVYPDKKDDEALKTIVEMVNEVDHFEEIYWPDPAAERYLFMIHELIRGHEFTDPHNDDSQMHFGFQCLDNVYATLTQYHKAKHIIQTKGKELTLKAGKALVVETRNDDTIKIAQRLGYVLVARKDPKLGHIRIKARPDADITLHALHEKITAIDHEGTWFFHGSGKMLLNGSQKNNNQKASPLTMNQIVVLLEEIYG